MKKIYTLAFILFAALHGHSQAWIELGTGSNALQANYSINALLTDPAGNVYAAGGYTDSVYPGGHAYVSRWNGSAWSVLENDSSSLNANGAIYSLARDTAGNIYAAGNFKDPNNRQYVAKWNGSTWAELGIDTVGLNATAPIYAIATGADGAVYAAGAFIDFIFAYNHYYVAKWNDSSWSEVGLDSTSGLNADSIIYALTADRLGHLYAAGAFTDTNGYSYVAKWDGTIWSALGTGAAALKANGQINTLITDSAGNVYAAGAFTDTLGHTYIAKWNGSTWTELSSPASDRLALLGPIQALALDSVGNVYAGGNLPDTNGNFNLVAEWNGSYLQQADNGGTEPLRANDAILAMASDI